jgi:hypothetical protein
MSEISDFIKANLGRTSSRLSMSFRKYLGRMYDSGLLNSFEVTDPETWKRIYPNWIKNVKQKSNNVTLPEDTNSMELYNKMIKTIAGQAAEIKKLKAELAMCKKNLRFQAPPPHVAAAMAEYGD